MERLHVNQFTVDKEKFESWKKGEKKYWFDDDTWEFVERKAVEDYKKECGCGELDFDNFLKKVVYKETSLYEDLFSYEEKFDPEYNAITYTEIGDVVVVAIAQKY